MHKCTNNNNNKRPLTPKSMPPAGGKCTSTCYYYYYCEFVTLTKYTIYVINLVFLVFFLVYGSINNIVSLLPCLNRLVHSAVLSSIILQEIRDLCVSKCEIWHLVVAHSTGDFVDLWF